MLRDMKKLGIIAAAVLLLAGCATTTTEDVATAPTTSSTSETATQEQVASVISRHAESWREVGDATLSCQMTYVDSKTGDPIAQLDTFSCFTKQRTALVTADTASKELRALTPPDSMRGLVDETLMRLDKLAALDLGVCGDAPDPADKACGGALTELDFAMRSLKSTLDAWGPYL